VGEIDGIKSSLLLKQNGSNLTGDLNKGGLIYNVVGIATEDSIEGRMTGSNNIENFMLQAEVNNGFLIIHLISHDLEKRTISKDSFTFKKVDNKNIDADSTSKKLISDLEFDNDSSLFGTWARQEILGGSEAAISTQVVIELDKKGNYKLLGAINLEGAKDTGYSGDTTQGKWRAHNGTFYLLVSGSKYWKPYARYNIEGNSKMTFTLEDGERQNWVKQDK
jgi:hypothetical protein